MAIGYVKLSRSLLEGPIFHNEKLLKVWIWCLLKASHKEHEQLIGLQKINLQPGQFITGRNAGAQELKMNPSTFWKYLLWLSSNQSLDIQSNNKFSLVTLINWELYQVKTQKSDSKSNSKMTTKEQQRDTNKNVKNGKNDIIVPYDTVVEYFNSICTSLPKVKKLTDSRKKAIKTCWEQMNKSMEQIIDFFRRVESSDFLTGRKTEWAANFDWVLKLANFIKIIEGSYDNRTNRPVKNKTQQGLDDLERLCNEFDRGDTKPVNQDSYCQLSNAREY